jgi:hypothetical protein
MQGATGIRPRRLGVSSREAGFEVWDPDTEILPGADWTADLKVALDSAGPLIVFISPEGMASRSVSYEIEYALGARHLRGRLIPVVIRPTKDSPWILDSIGSVKYQSPVAVAGCRPVPAAAARQSRGTRRRLEICRTKCGHRSSKRTSCSSGRAKHDQPRSVDCATAGS